MKFNKALIMFSALALLCTAANASTVFNFDTDNLGTTTTFTDSVNGISATFSSSADPGGFVVYPSMFETLTGNVLGDPGPAQQNNLGLNINFSQDLSAVVLDFATADFNTPSPFTLTAYENSNLVGSSTSSGQFLAGFVFPEGEIAFDGAVFNQLLLTTTSPDFAVDNITVLGAPTTASATPEPSAFGLLGAGLLAFALPALRRRVNLKTAAVALLSLSTRLASAQDLSTIFPLLPPTVSTIPSNGDLNPYGVVFVPKTLPAGNGIQPGDILISNFNNAQNLQGTGTTILRVDSSGHTSTFYTGSTAQRGLTAALGVLSNGVVLIGNLPTADGTAATVQPGNFSVLNRAGQFLGTFGTLTSVNGPWGMAVYDTGNGVSGTAHAFVSNVLSGTVSRFDITYTPTSVSATVLTLAEGFSHRLDPAALVLGPSGLVYSAANDMLYVASSSDNAIYEIPTAAAPHISPVNATLLFQDFTHLHGPLDLAILPNGHFLIANSDGSNVNPAEPSELVEYTTAGQFLGQGPVDPNNGGAFGLAVSNMNWGTFRMAAVDDNTNTLSIRLAVAQ